MDEGEEDGGGEGETREGLVVEEGEEANEEMHKLIIPNLANYYEHDADDDDIKTRRDNIQLLLDVAQKCATSHQNLIKVLRTIHMILMKPFKLTTAEQTTAENNQHQTYNHSDNNHQNNKHSIQQQSDQTADFTTHYYSFNNAEAIDSGLIVAALDKLFRLKLHSLPIDPAVFILDILASYLNTIYKCPIKEPSPAELPMILRELFSLLLGLRCNEHGYLGIKQPNQNDNNKTRYSPFITCVKRTTNASNDTESEPDQAEGNSVEPESVKLLSKLKEKLSFQSRQSIQLPNVKPPNGHSETRCVNLDGLFTGIIACITGDGHSDVLKHVLERLPDFLINKSLMSTISKDLINHLCISLSLLTRNVDQRPKLADCWTEILNHSLRSLTSLLLYRNVLEQKTLKYLLAAFGDSLNKCNTVVVPLLSICLVELHDVQEMKRFLPQVLDKLSKFSHTHQMANCRLEFLSHLILFPSLYENFSTDEYRCIFATALPYTNPFKYSGYVTCLAFRVLAIWYLECRPNLRATFVSGIKKSLQSNVIQPHKENCLTYSPTPNPSQTLPITHSCPPVTTQDQRKRSCSLNTENNLRRFEYRQGSITSMTLNSTTPLSPPPNSPSSPLPSTFSFGGSTSTSAFGFPNSQLSLQLSEELIETFGDLLSRYTHGQSLMTPIQKNPCVEFLLENCHSQTWLHGNSLVTITTSAINLGWAEILVRRPTGNMSWIICLQNCPYIASNFNSNNHINIDCQTNIKNEVISLFSFMALNEENNEPDSGYNSASTPVLSTGSPASLTVNSSAMSSASYQTKLRDPICLPKDSKSELAIKNFDRITPYEIHKIGVIYVDKGQVKNKNEILANKYGSLRYAEFLKQLGIFISLSDVDTKTHFIGGLDTNGEDGKYTYYWQDKMTQVIFHVATLMPNREDDPNCNNKHRHIGNDHVCIVYNDSRERFQLSTIKGDGQCIIACIIVTPLESDTNLVEVDMYPELSQIFKLTDPKVISNNALSLYVRQLAVHLNLASMIYERRQRPTDQSSGLASKSQYVSNWVERLRCIKRIRKRLEEAQTTGNGCR